MFTEAPHLESFWDWSKNFDLEPQNLLKGSDKKAWWLCEKGHSLRKGIYDFYRSGCGICSNKVLLNGFNDLATVRPDLAKEFDQNKNGGKSAKDFLFGTATRVWWLCEEQHSFDAKISQRNFSDTKCPVCSHLTILSGFSDLETQFPEVAKSWSYELNSPTLPSQIASSSRSKYWWDCASGHSWTATAADRTGKSQGCAVCYNRQIVVGVNDLQSVSPEVARTLAPGKNSKDFALTVTAHSRRKAWWLCDLRHEYFVSVRQRQAAGCAYCANQKVLAGFNDLASQNPAAAKYFLADLNQPSATQVLVSSMISYWWVCELGHEFKRTPSSVLKGIWCQFCGHRTLLTGFNDLATEVPHLAAEWHPTRNGSLTPSDVMNGALRKFWWLCPMGHTYESSGKKRRVGQGCPTCASSGYSPGSPGYLYLLSKEHQGLQQFGISNSPKTRVSQHRKNGWEVIDVVGPADGYWIIETETALKAFFRTRGLLLPKDYKDKFDGFTESWKSASLGFHSVNEMLEALRESED
jgi:hypothetical protein